MRQEAFQFLEPSFNLCNTIGQVGQCGRLILACRLPHEKGLDVAGEPWVLREVYGRLHDPAAASERGIKDAERHEFCGQPMGLVTEGGMHPPGDVGDVIDIESHGRCASRDTAAPPIQMLRKPLGQISSLAALPSPQVVLSCGSTGTTAASDAHQASDPLPGVTGYRTPRSGDTPQVTGPGRASPVPAATIDAFRAPYAAESLTAALPRSSPLPWPSP